MKPQYDVTYQFPEVHLAVTEGLVVSLARRCGLQRCHHLQALVWTLHQLPLQHQTQDLKTLLYIRLANVSKLQYSTVYCTVPYQHPFAMYIEQTFRVTMVDNFLSFSTLGHCHYSMQLQLLHPNEITPSGYGEKWTEWMFIIIPPGQWSFPWVPATYRLPDFSPRDSGTSCDDNSMRSNYAAATTNNCITIYNQWLEYI